MTNLPCNLGCETAEEHELRSAAMTAIDLPNLVRPKGVWRDQKLPCSLILSFADVPTDDDMRAWHEAADTLAAMVDERKDWARRFKLNGVTPWEWMTRAERVGASDAAWRILCGGKQKIIEQLEAERDVLRVDAERYRWLRDSSPPHLCVRIWQRLTPQGTPQPESSVRGNELDSAVDAARKS